MESIFSTTLRAFFKTIAVFLAIIIMFMVFFAFSLSTKNMMLPKMNRVKQTLIPDSEGNIPLSSNHLPVILHINIDDVIGGERINTFNLNSILTSAETLYKGRIKALLINMNSRGGSVFDSDDIYHRIKRFKESHQIPAFTFIDGICASGGYYIACATDKIYATAPSITGSVGVLMNPAFNFAKLMETYGIKSHYFSAGKNKQPLPAFKEWTPDGEKEQAQNAQNVINGMYNIFTSIVDLSRQDKGLTKEKIIEYGANIYISKTAKSLGYIDVDDSNFYACLKDLLTEAKIDTAHAVIDLQVETTIVDKVMNANSKLKSFFTKNESAPFEYSMEPMKVN